MPDVKIKGYSGNELHYADVPKVWLAAEESTEDDPVLVPFTYGEALDGVEIVPDFSVGDMQITVPEGYLARSAVVKRPDTLVPENVASGVNIAGIVGMLAEGKDVKIATGTFKGNGSRITVEHNLGVVPDIFIVTVNVATKDFLRFTLGFSSSLLAVTNFSMSTIRVTTTSSDGNSHGVTQYKNTVSYEGDSTRPLANATPTSISVGTPSGVGGTDNLTYSWIAIGGLT